MNTTTHPTTTRNTDRAPEVTPQDTEHYIDPDAAGNITKAITGLNQTISQILADVPQTDLASPSDRTVIRNYLEALTEHLDRIEDYDNHTISHVLAP